MAGRREKGQATDGMRARGQRRGALRFFPYGARGVAPIPTNPARRSGGGNRQSQDPIDALAGFRKVSPAHLGSQVGVVADRAERGNDRGPIDVAIHQRVHPTNVAGKC